MRCRGPNETYNILDVPLILAASSNKEVGRMLSPRNAHLGSHRDGGHTLKPHSPSVNAATRVGPGPPISPRTNAQGKQSDWKDR